MRTLLLIVVTAALAGCATPDYYEGWNVDSKTLDLHEGATKE